MKHYVYCIEHDGLPIYIGKTNNPKRRLSEHRKKTSLLSRNGIVVTELKVLDEFDSKHMALVYEKSYHCFFKSLDYEILGFAAGSTMLDEINKKVSAVLKNVWKCEHKRKNRSELLKGHTVSDQTREKIYQAMSTSKVIRCSNGEIYRSIHDASKRLGVSRSCISTHLRGIKKDVKGYTFTEEV